MDAYVSLIISFPYSLAPPSRCTPSTPSHNYLVNNAKCLGKHDESISEPKAYNNLYEDFKIRYSRETHAAFHYTFFFLVVYSSSFFILHCIPAIVNMNLVERVWHFMSIRK